MKKLFSLLLACMMLFLTSCNQTPPNETMSSNPQLQERPKDSELKDTIIRNGYSNFIDLPSRILFEYTIPEEDNYIFYYSKVDGKAYIYCFDPLCDHSGEKCLANPDDETNVFEEDTNIFEFLFWCLFFINNRFYVVTSYGQIYSMAFDGSDIKIEYGTEEKYVYGEFDRYIWSQNYRAYGKYIYIPTNADENEKYNVLRFNTETKEMENLTEKTGNFMNPAFFYNGEIYGRGERYQGWYKADLDMKKMEPIEALPLSMHFFGSVFYNTAYDDPTDYKNRTPIGFQAYDMKKREATLLTYEMIGLEEDYRYSILCVDENYIYFQSNKKILLGKRKTHWGDRSVYTGGGELYRVKHDGTECTLIYDNPNFDFTSLEAVICGDKIILEGTEYAVGEDGYVAATSSGMQIGTIGSDGTIEKFEPIELVY